MVKGISKQVILVKSPDPKLFEQAIFILSEQAVHKEGITDRELLHEANAIVHSRKKQRGVTQYPLFWACIGAILVGGLWLLSSFI